MIRRAAFLAGVSFVLAAVPARAIEVEDVLQSLTLEARIGQLFMVAIDTEIAARYEDDIRTGRLGGGLLRWDRFRADELIALASRLQEWSGESNPDVPFLIAVDHEGGAMFTQRSFGATIFPGNMALGAARSTILAEKAARASGAELRALGIHVNFAPVLDVNTNPRNPIIGARSFGENPRRVARLGAAAINGYLQSRILPVAKHFPGHGDTSRDSHTDLPVVRKTLKRWHKEDLLPFRKAIRAGVPMIMPAHIRAPALGAVDAPVTHSSAVLTGLLRGEMGFAGVIVSDSLDMGAVKERWGEAEGAIRAFEAGCDLLLLGKGDYRRVFKAFEEAVSVGRITPARVAASARRILEAKRRIGVLGEKKRGGLPRVLEGRSSASRFLRMKREHREFAAEIAEQAVTLVRDEAGLLPLRLGRRQRLVIVTFAPARFRRELRGFADALQLRHPRTDWIELPPVPSGRRAKEVLRRARGADVLILGSYEWGTQSSATQIRLIHDLLGLGKPGVLISLMNPYDLRHYAAARTALAVYGPTEAMLGAAARGLFGEIRLRGRLPVQIPAAGK